MKKILPLISGVLFFLIFSNHIYAIPGITASQAAVEYKNLMNSYRAQGLMRVDIRSILWVHDSLDTRIDSAQGTYFINGQKLYADLGDGSAYLRNDHWIVQLARDQEEIYIDTVEYDGDTAIYHSNQNLKADPFVFIDSLISDPSLQFTYYEVNDTATINTKYPLGQEILESTVVYSKLNYQLIYSEYKIAFERDTTIANAPPSNYDDIRYFLLKMYFGQTALDDQANYYFDESRFFKKTEDVYVSSENYPNFRIIPLFLGQGVAE